MPRASPTSSWQWIKVVIMKHADTYEKGLQYEEQAIYTSDLGTECEEVRSEKKKKNNKRKKTAERSHNSSEDEETVLRKLPPFPQLNTPQPLLNHSSQFLQDTSIINAITPQPFPYIHEDTYRPQPSSLRPLVNDTSCINATTPQPPHTQQDSSSNRPQSVSYTQQSTSIINSSPQSHGIHTSHSQPLSCSPMQSHLASNPILIRGKENHKGESFQQRVFRILEKMAQDIKEIKDVINIPKNPLPQLPPGCPKLPCENPEDLSDLNAILQDGAIFVSICDYLSTIGGSSVKDSTRRVLQQLIANDLSLKYNWKGTRGVKLGFAIFTSVTKLILGAVRNNPSSSSATEVEVNDIIKKWLMHAKDRDGGRNSRALFLNNTSV